MASGFGWEWADFLIGGVIVGVVLILLILFSFLIVGTIAPAIPLGGAYGFNVILANVISAFGSAISLLISPVFILIFAVALVLLAVVVIVVLMRLRHNTSGRR